MSKFKVPNLTTGHKLNNNDALAFMLGGNSWFTIKSLRTGQDYSFGITDAKVRDIRSGKWVSTPERKNVWLFIGASQVVAGKSYGWMGSLLQDVRTGQWRYSPGRNRELPQDCAGEKAFMFVFNSFLNGTKLPQLEIWHQGICSCCGKKLKLSESIELGWGPVCMKRRKEALEHLHKLIEQRKITAENVLKNSPNRVDKTNIIDETLGRTQQRPTSGNSQGNLFSNLPDHSTGVKRN